MEKDLYIFKTLSKLPQESWTKSGRIGSMTGIFPEVPAAFPPLRGKVRNHSFSQRCLLGFTNLLYFACFLPFRLTLGVSSSANPGGYPYPPRSMVERKQSKIQTVVCFLIHFILVCSTCSMTYTNLYSTPAATGRILSFHETAVLMLGPCETFYYIYTAWFRPQWFEWLLTESCQSNPGMKGYSLFEKLQNLVAVTLPIISVTASYSTQILYGSRVFHLKIWSFDFLGEFHGWIEGALSVVANYALILVFHMGATIYTLVILSFRDKAREFIYGMENQDQDSEFRASKVENGGFHQNPSAVVGKFLGLETYMTGLNERFGGWTLISIIFIIPFYSMKLVNFLKWKDSAFDSLLTVLYTVFIFFWLISAANISHTICDRARSFLIRDGNHRRIPSSDLAILSPKLTPEGIAIRGGNFFAISYSLIGTIVSLVMTWAFIDKNNA